MKKALLVLIVAAAVLALFPFKTGAGTVLPLREVFLGSRMVDFRVDHDEILVTSLRGKFSKLLFKVAGNAVEIFNLAVIYGNDQRDDIPLKLIFQEGNWSRLIDLAGGRRNIRKIIFNYRSIGPLIEGKAEIRVFGIR